MIDQNGHARLVDFGLLTFVSDPTNPTNPSSVTSAGTTRWMSPELLHPQGFGFEQSQPTKKSDCYALGMVILEVLSEGPPFVGDRDFVVIRKVIEGERPERPERAWFVDDLWRTLEQCWLPQPTDRPTIEVVLERLEQVSKIWQPPPIADDLETDSDDSDSTISEGMFVLFLLNLLLTAKKDKFVFSPSTTNEQMVIGRPPSTVPRLASPPVSPMDITDPIMPTETSVPIPLSQATSSSSLPLHGWAEGSDRLPSSSVSSSLCYIYPH